MLNFFFYFKSIEGVLFLFINCLIYNENGIFIEISIERRIVLFRHLFISFSLSVFSRNSICLYLKRRANSI